MNHPTSNPYETRPTPDGYLTYQIIPVPDSLLIERDVMVAMPDGVKLACNVYRPDKPGKFPVILGMTPYGKDQSSSRLQPRRLFRAKLICELRARLYTGGIGLGHQKISMLTAFEFADPAFWVPNDYVVVIVDQRGGFKSEGKPPTAAEGGGDLFHLIEWAAGQAWSNGNVGMVGVSALAMNQYDVASRQPAPPHLKAIIPWEGQSDRYRDAAFWGGIPETNFTKRVLKARSRPCLRKSIPIRPRSSGPLALTLLRTSPCCRIMPRLELITVPALICATWTDKGLHTRGTFEVFRRIASKDKWLYTHGGNKWDRFYSEDGTRVPEEILRLLSQG